MTVFDERIVTLHDDQYRVSPMRMVGLTSFTVSNKLRPSSPGKRLDFDENQNDDISEMVILT